MKYLFILLFISCGSKYITKNKVLTEKVVDKQSLPICITFENKAPIEFKLYASKILQEKGFELLLQSEMFQIGADEMKTKIDNIISSNITKESDIKAELKSKVKPIAISLTILPFYKVINDSIFIDSLRYRNIQFPYSGTDLIEYKKADSQTTNKYYQNVIKELLTVLKYL